MVRTAKSAPYLGNVGPSVLKNAYQDRVAKHRSKDKNEVQLLNNLSRLTLADFIEQLVEQRYEVLYATCREIAIVSGALAAILGFTKSRIFCFTRPRYLRNDFSDHFFNAVELGGREIFFDTSLHSRVYIEGCDHWVETCKATFFSAHDIDPFLLALHRTSHKEISIDLP